MRVPYKTLIKEFADNFNSKAVLCTMTETLETLDRNAKYAKEKDVFQDKEYQQRLKELAKEKKGADDKETANEKKKVDATEAEKSSVPASSSL